MVTLTPSRVEGNLPPTISVAGFQARVVLARLLPLIVVQLPAWIPGRKLAPFTTELITGTVLVTVTVTAKGKGPSAQKPTPLQEPESLIDSDCPCGCRNACTVRATTGAGWGPAFVMPTKSLGVLALKITGQSGDGSSPAMTRVMLPSRPPKGRFIGSGLRTRVWA